jgi:hypothetical protein
MERSPGVFRMFAATLLLSLVAAYAAAGVVFAVLFVLLGISRFDPAARKTGIGFRLVVFPGAVVQWPYLLAVWVRRR